MTARCSTFLYVSSTGLVGGQQAVVESLDDHHRQDHQAILVGLECTKEGICHIPNEGGLFLDILPHRGHLFICGHKIALSVSVSFCAITKFSIIQLAV